MVEKSGKNQFIYGKYPSTYMFLFIPGGCLGFLNHQHQPNWKKNAQVKSDYFLNFQGENKTCLKPPPRYITAYWKNDYTHHSPLLNHFWISWDPVYSTGHLLASKSRTSCTWQSEAMRRLRKLNDFHHISCPLCPVNARILKGTLSLEIMFIYKSKT